VEVLERLVAELGGGPRAAWVSVVAGVWERMGEMEEGSEWKSKWE
jgi:hypothetical protein